ncbi:MAG TPA: SBBP repeat-containing protein, partial [Rhodothermia bacterium]|nr:SBBP repeat-containing protein [Rhodothermia bacterium]
MSLIGASPAPTVRGLDALPGKSNYFRGSDPRKWQTNVPNYSRVRYEDLYPGIDLVYYGNEGRLEYDFVVAPGADPHTIRFAVENGNSKNEIRTTKIDANGDLVIATDGGEVRFHKPVVYQEKSAVGSWQSAGRSSQAFVVGGSSNHKSQFTHHKLVDGRFVLLAQDQVGFEVGDYDRSRALVIDPVLTYSTYLGGANGDIGYGVAVDAGGNAYVTGSTGSTDFPTATPLQTATGGDFDIFVAKVNPTGTALVYSTYLGGGGFDRGAAIAVDASGNAYLTGVTTSGNFPTTTGAFQTTFGGGTCGTTACPDAFVTKLNPDGSALVYSTYLGGSDSDAGQGIALDDSGNAYVTGSTLSTIFPTATPVQATGSGGTDAFVTKVNPDGTGLVYSTYLGGTDGDFGQAIAVNAAGSAYVTGYTFSTNLPTANPHQATNAGSADVFVAELDAAGSALVFSTYLGGAGVDRAFALALDESGDVFITGNTVSFLDFPVTAGAYQTTFGGGTCGATPCSDAFVAELDLTGSLLPYSTFLGGSKNDSGS